jgi:hypothetical protein
VETTPGRKSITSFRRVEKNYISAVLADLMRSNSFWRPAIGATVLARYSVVPALLEASARQT